MEVLNYILNIGPWALLAFGCLYFMLKTMNVFKMIIQGMLAVVAFEVIVLLFNWFMRIFPFPKTIHSVLSLIVQYTVAFVLAQILIRQTHKHLAKTGKDSRAANTKDKTVVGKDGQ